LENTVIKAVVFDFDGTLTELTRDFALLNEEVLSVLRRYVPEEALLQLQGLNILELIYELERRLGRRGADLRQEAMERLTFLELESAAGKDVFQYTRHTIEALRTRGLKIGIITRTSGLVVKRVFPDVEELVDAVLPREHSILLKPHPAHVRDMARALFFQPSDLLVVGDHPTDIMAGRAAGAPTAGVLSGKTSRAALEAVNADYVLADIRGVPGLLEAGKDSGCPSPTQGTIRQEDTP
jgi:phosphoglycolate phosphatase